MPSPEVPTTPTRRTLVLMRHAKAEWPDGPDFERPLADRGRADADAAGHFLLDHGVAPGLVVCSPAVRTRETWKLLAKVLDKRPHTTYDERVYEASAQGLLYLVQETSDELDTLMVVGHNPGIATLALALAGKGDAELIESMFAKFPTSGIAWLTFEGSWSALNEKDAELVDFNVPRG